MGLVIYLFIIYLFILKSILHPSLAKPSLFPKLSGQLPFGWVEPMEDSGRRQQNQRKGEPRIFPLVSFFFVVHPQQCQSFWCQLFCPLDSPIVCGPRSCRTLFFMVRVSTWLLQFLNFSSAISSLGSSSPGGNSGYLMSLISGLHHHTPFGFSALLTPF